MIIAELLFWLSLSFIMYTYFGYPLLLKVLSLFIGKAVKKGNIVPKVSFIIAAYNEEKNIAVKIESTLQQDYPKDRLEIIVASDGSTDRTDEIVAGYQAQGVALIKIQQRKGKENAQKHAVDLASGEIIVFSDVGTILNPDGVSNIVKSFYDPTVGCVSSIDRIISRGGQTSGEGLYVKYDAFIRELESSVNTLVGLSGSFFAARKSIYKEWSTDLDSDFNTLFVSIRHGLRGVLDRDSIGFYRDIVDGRKEHSRKIRTIVRGISALMHNFHSLNPIKYGLFSWQLFSHKLCRWLVPFFLGTLFINNAFLAGSSLFYSLFFVLHLLFYTLALLGVTYGGVFARGILRIPLFFTMVNLSILTAWYKYFKGERFLIWTPSERQR